MIIESGCVKDFNPYEISLTQRTHTRNLIHGYSPLSPGWDGNGSILDVI